MWLVLNGRPLSREIAGGQPESQLLATFERRAFYRHRHGKSGALSQLTVTGIPTDAELPVMLGTPDRGKKAFAALASAVATRGFDSASQVTLSAEQRLILIRFADKNVERARNPEDCPNRLALGRLQALYVARALATLDGPDGAVPFTNPELHEAYCGHQRFMASLIGAAK